MTDAKAKVPAAAAPGSPDFDVDNAPQEEYDKHFAILKRRADVAALSVTPLVAVTGQVAAPVSFTAPSAPLVPMYDTTTKLVQHLPQVLWDKLSDEDKARFTPADAERPADLPTA